MIRAGKERPRLSRETPQMICCAAIAPQPRPAVYREIRVSLMQNQFDALVNCSTWARAHCRLLRSSASSTEAHITSSIPDAIPGACSRTRTLLVWCVAAPRRLLSARAWRWRMSDWTTGVGVGRFVPDAARSLMACCAGIAPQASTLKCVINRGAHHKLHTGCDTGGM